ncbi:efflux RND transporter permease subunit [Paraliomyxa miuraensis]|uniref:efflux RND transporter permease subunit n=1 Tax=Paraliomyxa miuraensis TaxID=376150 RepID=UPI002254C165|nr:efflux RND transporter permease subunit [Paraliomyxa miuraensis]MCX4248111.1 efflux RND transporter permease subunit [Paraliomyxa miuraensis]
MIRALLTACLRQRVLVLVLAALAMVLGIRTASRARLDAFPEFAPPKVEIQTEAPGLSSVEVESLVTRPLEEALSGTPLSGALRSKSVQGLSSVVLWFQPGTDLLQARQLVQERVATVAPRLPTLARPPVILSPTSSTSRILKVGLVSDELSMLDLSDLARWTIRPRLMAIPGVANVAVWGERDRQLQVEVDPQRLRAHGLGLSDVLQATTEAVSPLSGGFVDGPNQRLAVSHPAAVVDVETLARAPVVVVGGTPLELGVVARIEEAHGPPIGDALIDGGSGILLIVEKQPWGSTLEVTRAIDDALAELAPALPGVRVDSTIFRPASFIERAIDNLEHALGIGCVLVAIVLVAFLRDWRTALISVLAIPLSLLTTIIVLDRMGGQLDTMILAGLAIALGEVVDDAIIDVENIHRRLRQNAASEHPRSTFVVVLEASIEVRSAVVYASAIVLLVFVPVYLLQGLAGSFFRPLALAYGLAIASSLLVALTVTPALALLMLPGDARRSRESALGRALRRPFAWVLEGALGHPRLVLGLTLLTLVAGGVGFGRLGRAFLPDFREQDFLMHWIAKPGASVEGVRRTAERVMAELLAVEGVRNAGAHIGRAEVADEVVGANFGEIWVSVDPSVDHDQAVRRIEATLAPYEGIYHDVQTYLRETVDEVLTGAQGALVVRIFGTDLDVLQERAQAVAQLMRSVPGTHHPSVETLTPVPQIEVRPRPMAARVFGLSPGSLRAQVTTLVQGARVGEVIRELRPVPVVVWGEPEVRGSIQALRDSWIETPDGGTVRLGDVAEVVVAPTPGTIRHEAGSRRIDVTCEVRGRPLEDVAAEIEAALSGLSFPVGHHAELLGEHAAQREAARTLLVSGALAMLGIVLVLYVDFRSVRLTALVVTTLPFALVGAVAAAYGSGGVLSLGSLVGLVTVLGIAARNGIMLVSHYRHLLEHEGVPFGRALVLQGTLERLSPILMTASCTALALVPLAVWGDRPGHEIEHPMAIVILGGLITSTVLNLLVTPVAYLWLGGGRGPRAELESLEQEPRP